MQMLVAADENWAIGLKGRQQVEIPADRKLFRDETMGKVVVLGRKTLETFPNGLPLSGRTNIILSSRPDYTVRGGLVVHSLEETLGILSRYPTEDVYVVGGAQIYLQFLPYTDVIHVTRIHYAYEADTYFPNLDLLEEWELKEEGEEQTYFDLEYTFCRYERRK